MEDLRRRSRLLEHARTHTSVPGVCCQALAGFAVARAHLELWEVVRGLFWRVLAHSHSRLTCNITLHFIQQRSECCLVFARPYDTSTCSDLRGNSGWHPFVRLVESTAHAPVCSVQLACWFPVLGLHTRVSCHADARGARAFLLRSFFRSFYAGDTHVLLRSNYTATKYRCHFAQADTCLHVFFFTKLSSIFASRVQPLEHIFRARYC